MATISRGVRAPIIRRGDDIVKITVDSVLSQAEREGFSLHERDVVAVTEAVVARADGNYASVDDIAADVKAKLGGGHIGLVFPILSRNRFSICLRGLARGAKKVTVMLSYPSDEVGNHLVDPDVLEGTGVNPWADTLTSDEFYTLCGGECRHPFTGVDYIELYRGIIEGEGAEAEIIFSNRPERILDSTSDVICCDIHTRARTKARIERAGGSALTLCDILNAPVNGSGFNPEYGLLGSNKATEDSVKLFPKNARQVAEGIREEIFRRTGVRVEAMVYGDGAFKDPVGKIWELADPVVSPGYTEGLMGLPNELKLKFLADNDYAHLSGEALAESIRERIRKKDADLKGSMLSQGTTPRMLTDLIGSLCDLTSGSGDKGTPIVLVQDYFVNYAD